MEKAFSLKHLSIIDYEQIYNPSVEVTDLTINGSSQFEQTLNSGQTALEFIVRGRIARALRMDLEVKIFDSNDIALGFFSPSNIRGSTPLLDAGDFEIRHSFHLPLNMNEVVFYMDLALSEPGKESFIVFPKAIRMHYEGTPTKTGYIFNHNKGSGWLYWT